MTGAVSSRAPMEENPRMPARWPSWNAHTTTPKVAVIDRRFMITALTGSTTLPVNSQRRIMLARRTKPMA